MVHSKKAVVVNDGGLGACMIVSLSSPLILLLVPLPIPLPTPLPPFPLSVTAISLAEAGIVFDFVALHLTPLPACSCP